MGQVFTVYVAARPRPQVVKMRRRLRGQTLARAKAALKYLRMAINHDDRYIANHANVPAEKLIFGGDTKAINACVKAVQILDDALTSQVQFLPAQ